MPLYKLSRNAVLESFDDGGLVLILPERRLVELNLTAVEIVKLIDGKRTAEQISSEIIKHNEIDCNLSEAQINQDILELIEQLNQAGVLELNLGI